MGKVYVYRGGQIVERKEPPRLYKCAIGMSPVPELPWKKDGARTDGGSDEAPASPIERAARRLTHEDAGTAYDAGACGHELAGRRSTPDPED